jgi:hypothetical protein
MLPSRKYKLVRWDVAVRKFPLGAIETTALAVRIPS